jgi:aspartate/methionine/tyrosine aminotransferase
VPRTRSDDDWCSHLLDREGILVHPGHFFDMEERGVMVVSLLPEDFEDPFERAARSWAEG